MFDKKKRKYKRKKKKDFLPPIIPKRLTLTPKEFRYVESYISNGGNKTGAARAAGYKSPATLGGRLFDRPKIRNYIDSLMAKSLDRVEIKQGYILEKLKKIAERCMQEAPVMVFDYEKKELVQLQDEEGRNVWKFDAANAIRALELLGKSQGMWTDNVKVNVNHTYESILDAANKDIIEAEKIEPSLNSNALLNDKSLEVVNYGENEAETEEAAEIS